ncbi:head decoration protein [Palleronia caenipelagi]|uniref:Head decoration protein n=1 Tax=Palleronia caenipelagi TaxID=2489174 RepID=A0A547PS42_9RHOB|nr:head decoration protein [Palleronia caenipelagi]TRD16958.1 head decoration protein [Palleronia caenipelagi]
MDTATMPPRNMAFLLSEASGNRSRTTLTIASGAGKLAPGTVLGKVTASGKYVAAPAAVVAGLEGAETAVAVLGYAVDATDQDVDVTAIDRDAEVKGPMLAFDATVTDQTKTDTKIAQLDAVGIRVR